MKSRALAFVFVLLMAVSFASCSGSTGNVDETKQGGSKDFQLSFSANGIPFKAVRTGTADPTVQMLDSGNNPIQQATGSLVENDDGSFTLTVNIGSISLVITGMVDGNGNISNLAININGSASQVSNCQMAVSSGGGSDDVPSGGDSDDVPPAVAEGPHPEAPPAVAEEPHTWGQGSSVSGATAKSKTVGTVSVTNNYVARTCATSGTSSSTGGVSSGPYSPTGGSTEVPQTGGPDPVVNCTGLSKKLPEKFASYAGQWCLNSNSEEKVFVRIKLAGDSPDSYAVYDSELGHNNQQFGLYVGYCDLRNDADFFVEQSDPFCLSGWRLSFENGDTVRAFCGDFHQNRLHHTFGKCPVAVE